MIYKVLAATFVFATVSSHASTTTCETSYRQAYVACAQSVGCPAALQDAHDIYIAYDDFSNRLAVSYDEAAPLFKSLGTNDEGQDAVLLKLALKMQDGELCNADASPKAFVQVVETLR